jgi:hypothetical protein
MRLLIDNRCEENPSVIYRSWQKHTRNFNYGMFAGDKSQLLMASDPWKRQQNHLYNFTQKKS